VGIATFRGLRTLSGLILLSLAMSCRTPATEVLVIVDTDAPARVLSMRAVVSRGTATSANPEMRNWDRAPGSPLTFPASFGVAPGETRTTAR